MANKVKIGIVGCGAISGAYFQAGTKLEILDIVACADLNMDAARAKAKEFNIPKACTVEELIADPEIRIVVNLTIPAAHAQVALATLQAGKHAYSEKPFSVTREDGKKILELAKSKNLLVGCAPDTFLGGGIQTCRKLIDDGAIGTPVSADAFMMGHGHESWHPNPDFYYQPGGGPMFDMGPYYLTALINLISPLRRIASMTRTTFPERLITSEPKKGTIIKVNTPTHLAGLIEFANGAVGTIITSFDVWAAQHPNIEIHGTDGSMIVPDPNGFGGTVKVRHKSKKDWEEVPLTHGFTGQGRGLGVADMAYATLTGRKHRANGAMAYHVLDAMQAFLDSWEQKKFVELQSTCERPAPLPLGLPASKLDE